MQEMHTPEKKKYFALKEAMRMIDCEVLVTFQGFAETWDADGEQDDDMLSVGTESSTASVRDLIEIVAQEEMTGRKLGDAPLRLWLPRGNSIYNGYKWKDSITKRLRVSQIEGYAAGQIMAYITADGMPPTQEEEVSQEATAEDEEPPQPYATPQPSPSRTEPRGAASPNSQSSKRKRPTDAQEGPEEQQEEDMQLDGEDTGSAHQAEGAEEAADTDATGLMKKVCLSGSD